MPGLKSARRRISRRQNSEDIEDARATQTNGHLDDVSDDEKPRNVRVKPEKKEKEKGKGKQRAVDPEEEDADGDADMDDDSDEDDRIDVADFVDQPLRRDHLTRLKGIAQDWDSMRKQITQRCDIYKDVATAMAEAGEADIQDSKSLQKLDAGIKEFIDVGVEMMAHSQVLETIHQKVARGEPVNNPIEQYENQLREQIDDYAAKSTRQKYAKDARYVDFHSSIWEVQHPDEPMPPITHFLQKERGDDSDSGDDVEMGGVTQNFLCPLTLTILVNPVTSKVCGHSFSRDALQDYFKNGRMLKCPASGCNKSFKFSDYVPDETLAKKVKAHQRRQKRAAETDSDDEEVVD